MKPELSPESQVKVAQALTMVEESRARMNNYTQAERAELERENARLRNQIENLLKPSRAKIADERHLNSR